MKRPHFRPRMKRSLIAGAAGALIAILAAGLAGCGHATKAKAEARASALATSTVFHNDLAVAENKLLACAQKHGFLSRSQRLATIQCAFPHGDSARIEQYAISTFSVRDIGGSDAARGRRMAWAQGVATYALGQAGKP